MDTSRAAAVASGDTPETYNPDAFPHPSVTVDVVALTAMDGKLCVLLVQRGIWPYEGMWALPGGFVRIDEDLTDAAHRELCEETGIGGAEYLEQLYTFGRPTRDPRTRVISVAYFALLPDATAECHPIAGTDAAAVRWWPIDKLPELAFDHQEIIEMALARLRAKLGYTSVAYALLPEEFTLTQLQTTYEIILARPLDKRNFRKKMLGAGILDVTPNQKRDGAHRPAQLYRFAKREPVFLD